MDIIGLAIEIYKQQIAKQTEGNGIQSFSSNMCEMIARGSIKAARAFKTESDKLLDSEL